MNNFKILGQLVLIPIFVISSCTRDDSFETAYAVSYEEALNSLNEVLNVLDSPETRSSGEKRKVANHYTIGQPIGEALTRSAEGELPEPYWNGNANGYYFAGAFDTNAGPVVTRGTSGHFQYRISIVHNIRK
jgi:hypothetical protein